jgi:flagellar biosynthesis/type III secretory pathway protein FliH
MDGLASAFFHPDMLRPGILRDDLPMSFGDMPSGILYVEDFDAPAVQAVAPAAPEAPSLSPADIDAARAEGRAAGLAEARTEQAAIQAELRTAAMVAIGDALGSARAEAARVAHAMADELAATLLALLQAALPAAAATAAGQEISALVAALLPGLKREPTASIHVHPDLLGEIAAALQTLWPDHGGRLALLPDAALAEPDVRVTWEDGEARRDTRALWQSLREALAPYGLPALAAIMEGAAHGG